MSIWFETELRQLRVFASHSKARYYAEVVEAAITIISTLCAAKIYIS